eukprot:scaffold108261_cov13-Tisochrysis_lutea.AAC.1
MWERQAFNLWRNTPSPPPGSREEAMLKKKCVLAVAHCGHADGLKKVRSLQSSCTHERTGYLCPEPVMGVLQTLRVHCVFEVGKHELVPK